MEQIIQCMINFNQLQSCFRLSKWSNLIFLYSKNKKIKKSESSGFQNPHNCLLLIRRWVPGSWIPRSIRGSVIWWTILPSRPSIIVPTYSCHGHAIMVPSLASFRNDNLDKLLHVSSSILQWMFGTERHFVVFLICVSLYLK